MENWTHISRGFKYDLSSSRRFTTWAASTRRPLLSGTLQNKGDLAPVQGYPEQEEVPGTGKRFGYEIENINIKLLIFEIHLYNYRKR